MQVVPDAPRITPRSKDAKRMRRGRYDPTRDGDSDTDSEDTETDSVDSGDGEGEQGSHI